MGLFRDLRKGIEIRRRLKAAPPILIFQMGKVGSTSLQGSLKKMWPGLTVHSHTVTRDLARNKEDVQLLYERVIQRGAPLYVISPVREPIGRNIAMFFQNFERHTGVAYKKATFSTAELIRIFLTKFDHDGPANYYDRFFKPVLAVDVYDYDFPFDGVQIIHQNDTHVLLMRTELPDSVKEGAVREFLNLSDFRLSNRNIGAQKHYADTYRKFIEAFIAPDWYIRRMYDSRFFNHFYGENHRQRLIMEWTQRREMKAQGSQNRDCA
ncbi:MAG TPA: putative capsular polysaccharide synthesis family protein [Candidatus Eisenbacteria bacterium]|nr:putative capsular polysaccharide synthesis family protein [Candidatus Eisenbacteria bacterium]